MSVLPEREKGYPFVAPRGAEAEAGYDRIAASGLFDPTFYRATYGVASDQDALSHFLTIGLAKGHLPSANFDPVLYRLAVADCGQANPLLHYLDHKAHVAIPRLEEVFPDIIEKFRRKVPEVARVPAPKPEKLQRHLANLDKISLERTIRVGVGGQDYRVEVPAKDFFFERLRRNDSFAFARLTHGYWDGLSIHNRIAGDPRLSPLMPAQRRSLAARIGQAAQPHHGTFIEGFVEEISELIVRHRKEPRFFNSVAFKGFPTADEDLFNAKVTPDHRSDRLNLLKATFAADDRLLDASLCKRLAFSGDLMALPPLCRNRHVVLIGPDYFHDLQQRWNLPEFTHVSIPRHLTHLIRWQVLDKVRTVLADLVGKPGPKPVVLLQCGSMAYWLIGQLFSWRSDIFYIDLGQALNIWFTDVAEMPTFEWIHFYQAPAGKREGDSGQP